MIDLRSESAATFVDLTMSTIRITREFSFEMAHALEGYDGACSQIHGHSYRLRVTLRGRPGSSGPKSGMLMDFGELKALVERVILARFDHTLLLRDAATVQALGKKFERVEAVDYQPTCENLIARFAVMLQDELPAGVELLSLRLHETAASFAEWFACDQA